MKRSKQQAIDLLTKMVEIPSLSGQESALATFIKGEMEQWGYTCTLDDAGNVIGELGSRADGPVILLLGHMDTVTGEVPVRREGDLLYGRGTVDAKGPLATFICAVREVGDLPARLIVAGAVEEETDGSRGAHFLLDRYSPDVVIIGEPSGWSSVVLGYKGRLSIRYEITRPQAHSAGPQENASELAADFWSRLNAHCEAQAGEGAGVFYRPSASLLRLEGTPERAVVQVSLRTPPEFDLDAFRTFMEEIRRDGQVDYTELTPAVVHERTSPPARALMTAIRSLGGKPGLKLKTGTSDMNVVSKKWQVPMIAYGPGDSSLDHTPDEHIDLTEYLLAIDVLSEGLRALVTELTPTDSAFTDEEEDELTRRLQALGYLD